MSDLDPYEEILLLSLGMRHVRTLQGAEFFHLPLGAFITPEEIEAATAANGGDLAQDAAEAAQDAAEAQSDEIADKAEAAQDAQAKAANAASKIAKFKFKGVPPGALGTKSEAEKSAAAYAKNPSATIFKNLPSHHPYNLPADHPRHLAPPASEAAALALDHQHHLVSGNPDTQFQPHPSTLTGPNEFSVGPMKYNVPAGSRMFQPKGMPNVRILITPDETVHAFTHVGEVDVPMDLQQAFADVLPPGAKSNDLYQTKNFDVAAPVTSDLKAHIQNTHDTKAAARYAAALVQSDHANTAAAAASPPAKGAPPVEPPAAMTPEEAGQHASITGALMHAHPGAELVNGDGETEFIKQPDGTWKHALFNATVDESVVQKLVTSGELHIKGAAPGLTHDFKGMSKEQWLAFLNKAPVGAKFQIDGKDMVKGEDKTWNGIPAEKMGTLRLIANNYEDGTGPAIPKKEAPASPYSAPQEAWKESPVPTGPDQITAAQIQVGDKVNGDPVTKTFKTETPGRVRVVTRSEAGMLQEHSWLKTTQIGVERANHGLSFDEKYPNANNGKPNTGKSMNDFTNTPGGGTAGQGLNTPKKADAGSVEKPAAATPPPKNENLAKPEYQPFVAPKESNVGSEAGAGAGGNQPASGNAQPAGSGNVPAHDGGNGNANAGSTGGSSEAVAGQQHPDGNGAGPGVIPPEIVKGELPHSPAVQALAAKGLVTPQMVELHADKGAQFFQDAISRLKENNPYAAAVYVHPVDEYKNMRLFVTQDGTAGFAVDGNNAVSLFISPKSPHKGGSVAMLTMQTELGARRLDAFDTVLPGIYAKVGYVPSARVKWDDNYAPDGWDKNTFKPWNNGEPDVVFMVHDPAHSDGTYHPGEGKVFASYDQAEAFTKKAALNPSLVNPANTTPGEVHHQPGEVLSHQDLKSLPPGHTVEHTPSGVQYTSQGQGQFLSHKSNGVGDVGLMKTAADAGKMAYHSKTSGAAPAPEKAPEPPAATEVPKAPAAPPAAPAPEKKSGPAMKKAEQLTKGDKIATGTVFGVDHINAPKGKVHVYYHNHKGVMQKGEWNKSTLIGYEAPKAATPAPEKAPEPAGSGGGAAQPPTPPEAPAAPSGGNAEGSGSSDSKQLWENGPQFSTQDIQAAHDALKNAGAFQVSYGFKSIPSNPLASHQAELKAEAKKQFPTMQPKAAVVKLLHNQLSPEQKAESKAEEVAKIHIGAKEPKPTQQGFNGGDYTADEIRHAIQALEADNGKLVKSILNKAGSPLGELSPITLPEVGFNKDKTITKQKFIDHLKSLLPKETGPKKVTVRPEKDITTGTIGTPLEKDGRFVAPPKAAPKKVTVRPEKDITTGTVGTPLEKDGRFKAKEKLPHQPGDLLTGEQVKALPDGHVIAWHTHDGATHPDVQHTGIKAGDKVNNDHGTQNNVSTLAIVANSHDPNSASVMNKHGVHYVGGPGATKLDVSKYKNEFSKAEEPKLPTALENFDKPEDTGHGLQPGDHVDQAAFDKLVPGDQIKTYPGGTVYYTLMPGGQSFESSLSGSLFDKEEMNPTAYTGMEFKGHDASHDAVTPSATPAASEAEMQTHDQAVAQTQEFTPATQDQINNAGVGSQMILHSVNGTEYPFTMGTNGQWHNPQMGEFSPDQIDASKGHFEMTKELKKLPTGDPKTVEEMHAFPEKTQFTYHAASGTIYDAAKSTSGTVQIAGLGNYTPEGVKDQITAGKFHVEHIPTPDAHPLSPAEVAALGVGSRVFYSGGFGRVLERKPDGMWQSPGGQDVGDVTGIGTAPIYLVSEADKGDPANIGYSPEILDAKPNSVVTYADGAVAKKMAYAWNLYNSDGESGGTLNPAVVAQDVADGHATLTHTPTEAQPFAPGKYISNGKAAMHVLPDGTGVYVASTGTTSKLSKANVLKNHDAGMSNYLGANHPVPEIAPKESKAPGAVTKAAVAVPTSKDIPDGNYYLKSKAGDSILVTANGQQVAKNGENIGDLKKLKLAFNKGQILDLNGTSITPVGYSGGVSLLDTPTTIPALLDLQKYLDQHPDLFKTPYWYGVTDNLSAAGFPLSLSAFVKAYNETAGPGMAATTGHYFMQDAPADVKEAMANFFSQSVANLLAKVDTAIPDANTSALFDWTTNGQAKPPLQLVSIPKISSSTDPATLNAYVKQITEALGAQKIFNLTGMTKYAKMDWINAVKKGNFAHAYDLEVASHSNKGKVHPSGYLHPGYEGNAATNKIQWGPAVEGEVPAGVPVEGNWTSIGVAASTEELQNYLIAAHMQHPEHLTLAQQRSWVTYHRTGDKQATDQLSAMAAVKAQNGDPQISPTPVWTDNVQPAKSYAVWFDKGPFPTENDIYNGLTDAPAEYLKDNAGNAELQKSWDAWSSPYKNNYTSLQDMAHGGSWGTQKKFLTDHFTRLREEAAAEEAKPKFSLVKEIAQGQHPAYLVEDHGNQYIFKPVDPGKDYRAEIEAAALQLGALWGFTEPTASVQSLPTASGEPMFGGQVGLLQSLIPNVGNMNFADGPVDIASLHPKQLGQIAAEHVLDWAIDNNDGHGDNLLMTPDGNIVGIDKGRAFAAFGTWDGLNGPGMNYQAETIASKLFMLAKAGVLTQEQMDGAYKAALKAANKIFKSPDASAVSIIAKGLANRPHYQQGPGSKEAVIQAFLDRKHGIVDDINKLWTGIYAKSGLTKPEPPVKALNEDLQSGFHEPDLSAAIQDKAVWGVTTFHASPDIKKGSVLIWQEKNSNGDPVAKGLFAVNKYAEGKLLSWLDGHLSTDTSGSYASAQSLANFPNMEPFRKALSTAGREVSDHLESGNPSPEVMQKFQETKDQLLADAQFGDTLPVTAGQGTDPIKFPSGNAVDPGALGQYRAALTHYLDAAYEVEQAQKEQRKTEKSLFGIYHPIAAKTTPATYLNPEKGLAYTELTTGDFITNMGVVVPASQLPDGAKEGLNGWTAINGAQQSSGLTVVKEHAGDLAGALKEGGLKEQSDTFSTAGHNGSEYVVHLTTGEYIRFRNSDHTSTDQSQWDQIRFRLSGSDHEASLSRVEAVLNQMGLDMSGAEPEHTEDIYWKEMFNALIGSSQQIPAAQKQVLEDMAQLRNDLMTEHGVSYDGIADKHLIEAIAASKTVVPDQHQFWHDKAVQAFGQKKVDEWLAAEKHLPQFQHFDLANPEKTTGHAFWNRLDFTLEQILAKQTLLGQGTMGKDKSLANFIKSGNSISTEERLRMLGVFGHGISKESDQPKGGANYVFARTAYDKAKYEGAAGFGPHVIYWNPALFLQTGTKGFNYDAYGEQDSLYRAQADILKALRHGNMDNETDIQNAISVFDYMEIMIFDLAENRNAAIQKMKALGHAILRGVPIEERLIMRQDVNKAMATVMAAWGKNT